MDEAMPCLFASDLHGSVDRYRKLLAAIEHERPVAVFLGGDLLPGFASAGDLGLAEHPDFLADFLAPRLRELLARLGADYPRIFAILGNDDGRAAELGALDLDAEGLWTYAHGRQGRLDGFTVHGYSFVPPTPFHLKDWERYDVSRYVDPGCVPPDEGFHSTPDGAREARGATIRADLDRLAGDSDLSRAVFLFHAPPYRTHLDRASLDGLKVDHAPLDVHVGSIAIRTFLEQRQPWLALHGHVHESARLTGSWRDRIGRTWLLGAAHDGAALALVRFDLERPGDAERALL